MTTLVVYHKNCHDGLTALWCALAAYPDAEIYEGDHGAPARLPAFVGRDVIFVDFCWKRSTMIEIRKFAQSVLVLDHHKTAMEDMIGGDAGENIIDVTQWVPFTRGRHEMNTYQDHCEGAINTIYALFDMYRSGAGIAWDVLVGGPRPRLVDYVEDRDLWRFKLENSREVHAASDQYPLTIEGRRAFMERDIGELIVEGRTILRYQSKLIDTMLGQARTAVIPIDAHQGRRVAIANCSVLELVSEVGHELCRARYFGATYFDRSDGRRQWSLRSDADGMDVGKIAAFHGGGGHKHAAGFIAKPGQFGEDS